MLVALRTVDEAGRRRVQVERVVDHIQIRFAGAGLGGFGPVAGQAVAMCLAAVAGGQRPVAMETSVAA